MKHPSFAQLAEQFWAVLSAFLLRRGAASDLKTAAVVACFLAAWLTVVAFSDRTSVARQFAQRRAQEFDELFRALRKESRGERVVALQGVGLLGVLTVAVLASQAPLLLLAAPVAFGPGIYWRRALLHRRQALEAQVPGFAEKLAQAMRSTGNVGDAIRIANDVTLPPMSEEISVGLAQMSLGSSLQDMLNDLSKRGNVPALDVLTSALIMARTSGGDVPLLMDKTSNSLREILDLQFGTRETMRIVKSTLVMSLSMGLAVGVISCYFLWAPVTRYLASPGGYRVAALIFAAWAFCVVRGWLITRVRV